MRNVNKISYVEIFSWVFETNFLFLKILIMEEESKESISLSQLMHE